MSALPEAEAWARLARNGAATSRTAHTADAAVNKARSRAAVKSARHDLMMPNGTLSRHVLPVPPAPGRRRAHLHHVVDDRACAHAHLLGRHVLPLRVPGDL